MNHYKNFKKYLKYFKENNNSADFLKYLDNKKESLESYVAEQKNKKPNKEDYYEESDFSLVSYYIYDFLTNEDIIKAIDRLNKLSKEEYAVDCSYKKSTRSVKYNYVQLEYSHSSQSLFADVCFKKDKFIDHIHISCTQVNNYYMMLEYEFKFKHKFDSQEAFNEFLNSNMEKINKNDFFVYDSTKQDSRIKWHNLNSFKSKMLSMVMQHFVTTLSYSPNGKYYKLNSLEVFSREKEIDINNFVLCDDLIYYYNKKENYFIQRSFGDDTSYTMLCGKNMSPKSPLIDLISEFGNEAYYLIFGYEDLRMFENKYNSSLQGTKKANLGADLFDELITKVHSVSDYKKDDYQAMNKKINCQWELYSLCKKEEINIEKSCVSYYRRIYSQNLDVLKMRAEISNIKENSKISKYAIVIAILSILVAIILGIIQICLQCNGLSIDQPIK